MLLWVAVLALTMLLYLLLDGFDLGVGVLFGLTRDEEDRRRMLSAISPVWDGNETWLILAGTVLFGAFPKAFAAVLSAFYLPIIMMLGALILRGVAFEFRYKTIDYRWVWNGSFAAGSLVASFMQGVIVGSMVQGVPVVDGQYAGSPLGWLTPFACLCGVGLCFGYALLGASWLVGKTDGVLRKYAYGMLPFLTIAVGIFLLVAFLYAAIAEFRIMARWFERPYLLLFPALGVWAAHRLYRSLVRHDDFQPFRMVSLVFIAAFATLAISFWPYMIPFSLSVQDALAPESSLNFMFWPSVIVLPLICVYNATVYWLFRGKVRDDEYEAPAPVLLDYSSTYPENSN
jgi:cytochrome d ubiquinol oxidase subunit II